MLQKQTAQRDLKAREEEAAQSAFRAAGYCGHKHPSKTVYCTRPPGHHPKKKHGSYYQGRASLTDAVGIEWP